MAEMSQDDKLTLILRETKGTRKDTRKLTNSVQQLENEVASSSNRLDTVENQITSLLTCLGDLKPCTRRCELFISEDSLLRPGTL